MLTCSDNQTSVPIQPHDGDPVTAKLVTHRHYVAKIEATFDTNANGIFNAFC